jgi:hypothetical protein
MVEPTGLIFFLLFPLLDISLVIDDLHVTLINNSYIVFFCPINTALQCRF